MATRYAVETVFKLIDEFTAPLAKLSAQGKGVGDFLKNDLAKAEQTLNAVPGKMLEVGKTALKMGAGAVTAGLGVATKQYIDFDNAITAAGAKFKDLDVTSADYQSHLAELGTKAREVAAVTQFNAVDTAGALDKMAMAGLGAGQSMALLSGTADLATTTGLDLTSAVDMATDALGAFNLMKDEFGQPLDEAGVAASLQRVSDVVAKTTNMANTDMNMWFEAVKKGAPAFTVLGGNIEDFSAMVGVLANSGLKGSEAGTAIRNMMLNISAPISDRACGALERLGISAFDAAGNMRPILEILGQFEKSLGGTNELKAYSAALAEAGGDEEKVNIRDFIPESMESKINDLQAIFGKRTVSSMLVLLSEGQESLSQFSQTLKDSKGAATDMANAMRQSISVQIQVLFSALTELGFKFVEVFKGKGVDVIQKLTEAVSTFDPTTLINGLIVAGNVISSLASTAWHLRGVIVAIVSAVTLYKATMLATAFVMKTVQVAQTAWAVATGIATGIQTAHNAAIWGTTVAIEGNTVAAAAGRAGMLLYAAGSKIAAAAQWVLNASLFGCPITWIIAGIVALVAVIAGVIVAVKNWGAITEWLSGVWTRFTVWLGGVFGAIAGWFASAWETISSFFSGIASAVGGFFAGIWESVTGFFSGVASALPEFFSTILDNVLSFLFGQNAPAVKQFLADTVASVVSFFTGTVAKLGEFLVGVWTAVSAWFVSTWEGVSAWFASVWEGISGFFSTVWNGITELGANIAARIGEVLAGVWEGISGWFSSAWEGVLGIVEKIRVAVQPMLDFILGVFQGITGAWQGLVAAFQAGGLIGALQQIGGAILSFLLAPIEKILGGLTWVPGIGGKIEEWQASIASLRAGLTGGAAARAPATVAPITARDAQSIQTERFVRESTSNSNVTIGLERGLTAQVSEEAPNVRVNQYHSGGF